MIMKNDSIFRIAAICVAFIFAGAPLMHAQDTATPNLPDSAVTDFAPEPSVPQAAEPAQPVTESAEMPPQAEPARAEAETQPAVPLAAEPAATADAPDEANPVAPLEAIADEEAGSGVPWWVWAAVGGVALALALSGGGGGGGGGGEGGGTTPASSTGSAGVSW